jgi:hypothetical protein
MNDNFTLLFMLAALGLFEWWLWKRKHSRGAKKPPDDRTQAESALGTPGTPGSGAGHNIEIIDVRGPYVLIHIIKNNEPAAKN